MVLPLPADFGYLDRLEEKMGTLQRNETGMRQQIASTQQDLVRGTAGIELEFERLKLELALLERDARNTVMRVRGAVEQFRTVAKKADLIRLQQRIDLWAPEQKMTRQQFQRLLADEFS